MSESSDARFVWSEMVLTSEIWKARNECIYLFIFGSNIQHTSTANTLFFSFPSFSLSDLVFSRSLILSRRVAIVETY